MPMSRWSRPLAVVLLLAATPYASSCSRATREPTGSATLTEQQEARQTAVVTTGTGMSFTHATDRGTVAAFVLPGAFEDGTALTFTPLASDAEDFIAGFRLTATRDVQPKAPVYVAFALEGDLPPDVAVFAYEDGSDEGREIVATPTAQGAITGIVVPVTHLTSFTVERRGSRTTSRAQQVSRIDFDSDAPFAGAPVAPGWTSRFEFSGELLDSGGGRFIGPVTLAYFGELDTSDMYGLASAQWTGLMQFGNLQLHLADPAAPSAEDSGTVGAWIATTASPVALTASGTFTAVESEPFWAWVEVEGIAGRVPVKIEQSIFPAGSVPCSLWMTASGIWVWIGDADSADTVPAGPFLGRMTIE